MPHGQVTYKYALYVEQYNQATGEPMNKLNKLQLQTYITKPTDLNLSLFACGLNVAFKLDKSHKAALKELVEQYNADQNKMRLDIMERYIMGNTKPMATNRIKPSELKRLKENPEPELVKKVEEMSIAAKEMEKLREEIMVYRRIPATGRSLSSEQALQEAIRKLFVLEKDAGMYDDVPPEKSKYDVVIGLLGHWDDPESLSYELFNGNKPQIQIKTNDHLPGIIADMQKLADKYTRKFYVSNNMMSLMGGNNCVTTWTLTDVNSGIRVASIGSQGARKSTMVDGQIDDTMDLVGRLSGSGAMRTGEVVQWNRTKNGRLG